MRVNLLFYYFLTRVLILTCLLFSITGNILQAQNTVLPKSYWTFNQSNMAADSMQSTALNFGYYNCQYNIVDGKAGKALELDVDINSTMCIAGELPADSNIVVEFYFKPGMSFNESQFFWRGDDAVSIAMSYPVINFHTIHTKFGGGVEVNKFDVDLTGVDRKSFGYYTDGNWHHMVFKFNAAAGKKEIWVDGVLASGFSTTFSPGLISNTNANTFYISSITTYYRYNGALDEIAIYSKDLPAKLIYKHYLQGKQGLPYSFVNDYTGSIPAAPSVVGNIDLTEYAPGHPSVNVHFLDQLKSFPSPRFKRGHTLHENFQWINPEYASGRFQPEIDYNTALSNSIILQEELAKNFNYSILVSENTTAYYDYNDLNTFSGAWVNLANQNPLLKTAAISFWQHIRPDNVGFTSGSAYGSNQTNPNNYYLRNSAGQFLDPNGNTGNGKWWSPASPLDSVVNDGLTQKFYIEKLLLSLTRPLNNLNENGEILPYYFQNIMQMDPAVVADKAAGGFSDWYTYYGNRIYRFTNKYKNEYKALLQQEGTHFSFYGVDGSPEYRAKYSEMRNILSTLNGQKYATSDFYPRYPSYWKGQPGAWHGLQWMFDCRINEIALGDNLYSPFVAAGWDKDEEQNIRPAQWLGLLKILSVTGAEYFYSGFFNDQGSYQAPYPPPAHPKNYIWQEVVPAYAQGIASRFEDLLRNGQLHEGNVTNKPTNTLPGYRFKTGDPSKVVCARKHNTLNKYVITGAIEQNTNLSGNVPNEAAVTVDIDNQKLKFNIRRQGSVYFYDKTNLNSPVFYQLDDWHENSHPYYWNKDFNIEAELFDNNNATAVISTVVPAGTATGDFTSYTTTVSYNNGAIPTPLEYDLNVRENAPTTYYVWVRARSRTGAATGTTVWLDNAAQRNIACISSTDYHWYRLDSTTKSPIEIAGVTRGNHTFRLLPHNNAFQIDKIVLTKSAIAILDTYTTSCSVAVTQATITASGPVTFCAGKNVVLTAGNGVAYLWSSGAVSQSITTTTSGTYTVTVTYTGGATSSASQVISVLTIPATPVIFNDFNTGNGYTLYAQQPYASSFIWSTGATTGDINIYAAGTYTVMATNGVCQSTPATVSVTSLSPKACTMPDMLSAHDITATSAIIQWNGALSADSFQVVYYADYTNVLFTRTVAGTDQFIRLSNLTPAKGYKVSIVARCGTFAYYSSKISFTTLTGNLSCGAIPHDLRTAATTTNTAQVEWCGIIADSLQLRYRTVGSLTWNIIKLPSTSSASLTALLSNKNYQWNLRSFCNGIASLYSYDSYFNTQSASGSCNTPTGVQVNAVSGNSAEVIWDNTYTVDTIIIKYRIPGVTPYKFIKTSGNPNSGNITIENLLPSTTYKVEMKYICGGISSDYSAPLYFTTNNAGGKIIYQPAVTHQESHSPINIYPNPAHGIVTIDFNSNVLSKATVHINNTLGLTMFSHEYEGTEGVDRLMVNIEGWPAGIYWLICSSAGNVYRVKLNVY